MSFAADDREVCAICGRDERAAGHWFCHFYPRGRPVPLCSPVCAEVYLARPDNPRFSEGEGQPEWSEAFAVAHTAAVAPAGTAFPM